MGKRERDAGKVVNTTPSKPLSEDVARAIVTAACKEATDVLASMVTDDPSKKPAKPRTLKDAVKDTIVTLVTSGDPRSTLDYIKGNKKEFISAVFQSCFMSAVRKKIGEAHGTVDPSTTGGEKAAGEKDDSESKVAKIEA